MTKFSWALSTASVVLLLGGCNRDTSDTVEPPPAATPTATGTESILRPDVEAETAIVPQLEPLTATIGFADSGSDLTNAAKARLDRLLNEPQFAEGWLITLGGHSDAGGNDAVNLRVSRERAEAIATYLAEKGIAESRIRVVAFGEQNPVAPNALPDGEPNEAGRAKNRRVELVVAESGGLNAPSESTEDDGSVAGQAGDTPETDGL